MTDEDTNNRMERANRIREMREGRRRTPADGDDAETSDATTDGGEAEAERADASDAVTDAGSTAESETANGDTVADGTADGSGRTAGSTATIDETVDPPGDSSAADDDPEPFESTADGSAGVAESEETTDASTTGADGRGQFASTDDEHAVETSGFEFEDTGTDDSADQRNGASEGGDDRETASANAATETGGQSSPQSGVTESVSSAGAAEAVDALSGTETFAIPDQATTVSEDDEQSMLNAEGTVAAARAAAAGRRTAHGADQTRVLEFDLGDERFCLDIEYIEEIVELENMTRVPNSPSHVEGVVDLRGQVTAIINPKDTLAVDDDGRGELIVVFDSEEMDEQGHLGWVVDEVRQVTPVTDEDVNESPDENDEHINGVINREDEDDFIVWTTPDLASNSSSS